MDPTTYRNIGHAFSYAERIEAFGTDARPVSNLALWPGQASGSAEAVADDQGVANMLMEGQYGFEVLDRPDAAGLARFDTIVLTGSRCLTADDAGLLRRFVSDGGHLLVLNDSVFEAGGGDRLAVDIGADYAGPAHYGVDYTAALPPLATDGMASPFLNYASAPRFAPAGGRVLARVHEPYFDRTYGQYCSHQNAPNRPEPAGHIAAVQHGRVVYLAHPLGRMYLEYGAPLHRDLFLSALAMLYRTPTVRTTLPSCGRFNLLHQPQYDRYVLHLLYGPPIQRGKCLVLEDLVELSDIRVTFNLPRPIKTVSLPLRDRTVGLENTPAGDVLDVPPFRAHEIVLLNY